MQNDSPKRVIILGATGSIGDSALRVIRAAPEKFRIVGMSAQRNAKKLAELAHEFSPAAVAIEHNTENSSFGTSRIYSGPEAALDLLEQECDVVIAAITGAAGLAPVMRALELGRTVALANKEALVCAGYMMLQAAATHGGRILPVDSEHNAIFQALAGVKSEHIDHITLTASGGPFLHTPLADLPNIQPMQAIAHPKWNMGAKISVDSATMMNKGLELIEAHFLFNLPPERIHVVIHPQAIIHGLVHCIDGSVIAQMSEPDMAVPLSYCLHWPERGGRTGKSLSLADARTLEFHPVDAVRFPALSLAIRALKQGPAACIALNAANEIAVHAFLSGHIGFTEIVPAVADITEQYAKASVASIEDVLALNDTVRTHTQSTLEKSPKRYA